MQESRFEAAIGALVLLGAIAFLFVALNLGGIRAGAGYPLTASFRSVEGIAIGSEIRMAGVAIGRVADLDLDVETFRAEAVLTIQNDVPVPEDSTVAISSDGLLGDSFVEIIPGGSLTNLSEGEEILDTQGAISLIGLLLQFISSRED